VIYHRRFLLWWGLLLFLCKLGSRRQLDFQFRDLELQVLANLNRLSDCQQDSLPVHKTLSHFLSHVGSEPLAQLRTQCVRRLIRIRSKIENQGFNIQKNSGLNLEHAYSTHPDVLKAFYYLLQIAHLFLQMFEMGSLLQQLAKEYATSPVQLFGSLKNLNQRLLECLRYFKLDELAFSTAPCQIRLLDSS
jgi:hypothetical protein